MFANFASNLTTELNTSIPAALTALVGLYAAIQGLGWGLHFLRRFGVTKRA